MPVRSALVAYGTETGNAYDYAEELARCLERIRFLTHVSKLDAVDTSTLKQFTLVIIVVSTTGQGDLPINARSFWKHLLRKKLPPTHLKDVRFTTFGLGDSSYPKFNWAARKIHKRLVQLGANEIYRRGEADEQHEEGLDATFVPWCKDFCEYISSSYPLPLGVVPIPETTILEPKWELSLVSSENDRTTKPIVNGHAPEISSNDNGSRVVQQHPPGATRSHVRTSRSNSLFHEIDVVLTENSRMTPDSHWQDVRHLAFDSKSIATYEPGDVLTIYPKNVTEDVSLLLKQMDWTEMADKPIIFTPTMAVAESSLYPPPPIAILSRTTTLRSLLTEHIDMTAIPRRSFFSWIAHFTDDQFQRDRLLEFTDPKYIDELYDYTTRPRRSILEVLQEFDTVRIPWQWAASVLPELRGRQFSIASGGELKKSPGGMTRFELLVAIVKYKTVIKKIREGVCTRYLANSPVGTELCVTLQQGSLNIINDEAKRPVIMIGPGTGIAPMRSLILERLQILQQSAGPTTIGPSVLFFGCRSQNADYFYQKEWARIKETISLEVHAAFSRDQNYKVYVQDRIREQSESVFRLLHEANGLVYVCGSSGKMPQAVRAALIDVFIKHGMHQDAADSYLETMEKEGRYKQETW